MAVYNAARKVATDATDETDVTDVTESDAATGALRLERATPARRITRYVLVFVGMAMLAAVLIMSARAAGRWQVSLVALEKQTGLSILQPSTYCRNYDTIVYKTEPATSLDLCQAKCADDVKCNGVLYARQDSGCVAENTCALYTGSCDTQEHTCWQRVDVKMLDKFPVIGWGKGCMNWKSITLDFSFDETAAGCYERCRANPVCTGFGYQVSLEGDGAGIGACGLRKEPCHQGDNRAWNEYTMTSPTSDTFELKGVGQFCRNYNEILLSATVEYSPEGCSQQCTQATGCIGFSYKLDESCTSESTVTSSSSCHLYKNECIPEPNACWNTFRMTQGGEPDLTNVPQTIPDGLPSQINAFPEGAPKCATNVMENKISVDPKYDHLDTLEKCTNLCYITFGCRGLKYTAADKSCLLLDELCFEVTGPVSEELQLEATGTDAKVSAGVTQALGAFAIDDATVAVSKVHRRLMGWERNVARKLVATKSTWKVTWTSKASGTAAEQVAAAKIAFVAASKWQSDLPAFVSVLEEKMAAAGSTLTAGSVSINPPVPQGGAWPADVYELTWVPASLTTNKRVGERCSNWNSDILGPQILTSSRVACAVKCQATPGCTSFNFQKEECDTAGSTTKGLCILLKGSCVSELNSCWDAFDMELGASYVKNVTTTATAGQAQPDELGTTITVSTTKAPPGSLKVFINEVRHHSQNPKNTGVEIAGPDKEDLTGYKVVAYDLSGTVLLETSLSGTISAKSQQKYGVVWAELACQRFSAAALVRGGAVRMFVSVKSSVKATEGPAKDMTSKVIKDAPGNLLEVASEDQLNSLQLFGTGLSYEAFTWRKDSASPNEVNTLQNFDD